MWKQVGLLIQTCLVSQNAKEPGDACRIPRGAWKLHRCIEHATRLILYRMEPTFYLVVGANFRPQPLALWVSMTSTIKWRKSSNLFDEICDMTDHDWHCLFILFWDVQEINRWKKDVLLSSFEFDSFDSAKLRATDWVRINQGLLEAQAARQLQAQCLT